MTQRRYGDEEVREIFSLATTGGIHDRALPSEAGGLTLDEVQRIGEEAGIEPARVAQAAMRLDAQARTPPTQRSLGFPVGMSRVVHLPRAPTDREWEQLISQFRSTFGTPGVATTSGGLREWSQGDVHIATEPTEHGEQLRITTRNEATVALNGLGVLTGGMSVVMGSVVAFAATPEKALAVVGMFGAMALAAFGANLFRSPRWRRSRTEQIAAIAEHVVKVLSSP